MKKIILLTVALGALPAALFAQARPAQGLIRYEMTINLRKEVAKKNPAIAALVPEKQQVQMTLAFKNGIYALRTETADRKSGAGNQQMTVTISGGDNGTELVNLPAGTLRSDYRFNNRNYYTQQSLGKGSPVKFTNESRIILGYPCRKAIVTGKNTTYIVWYTTDLPFAYSPEPEAFAGIKGAVLEYGTPTLTCKATAVTAAGFRDALIATPNARKITPDQLEDLRADSAPDQPARNNGRNDNGRTVTQTIVIEN